MIEAMKIAVSDEKNSQKKLSKYTILSVLTGKTFGSYLGKIWPMECQKYNHVWWCETEFSDESPEWIEGLEFFFDFFFCLFYFDFKYFSLFFC